jgi:hypothetical protein
MKNKKYSKETIVKSLLKMISDKSNVRSYIKGEISLKTVSKKGVHLAKPV